MQLIVVPENRLHLYFKKGRVGDDPNAEERLEEWDNVDGALKEFVRLFEEITGNEFEPWEREKKFQKKPLKFYPIDMVYYNYIPYKLFVCHLFQLTHSNIKLHRMMELKLDMAH